MTLPKLAFLAVVSLLVGPFALAASAQTSAASCSAVVADHATIGGIDAQPGTAIFSGELLRTSNEGQLMVQCRTVKLGLGSNSSMRVFQSATQTSVELEHGIVAYSTAGQSEDLTLYGLDVKIVPDTKQPAIGQVDVSSDCELSVQSTKGTAAVTSDRSTKTVEESKAYDVTPKLGVDYSDDWRPIPADYPDFPRQAKYHESHSHVPCAAAVAQNAATKGAIDPEVFRAIAIGGALTGGGIVIWHVISESPSKPSN